MTVSVRDIQTPQYGTPDIVIPQLLNFPVAAATQINAGTLVATDANGNALGAAGANSAARVWGRCEKQVINTVAAGYGTAGQRNVEVRQGCFGFSSGSAGDAITQANVGQLAYVIDDNTVGLTAGTTVARPVAGTIIRLEGSKVYVQVGMQLSGGAFPIYPTGTLPAPVAGDIALTAANVINDGIYQLPAIAANSTVTLPAGAADGTQIVVVADGIANGFTTQFRDGTGNVLLTTALVASKRFEVICVKKAGLWYANAYSAP